MHQDDAGRRDDELIATDELQARARALDGSDSDASLVAASEPFLAFAAAGERFAVPLAGVHEVLRGSLVVPIPHTPVAVRGVVNRRGDIVPVLDLAVLFGRPASGPGGAIVIVGHAPMIAGLLTDGSPEIVDIPNGEVGALPHQSRFIRGIWRHGERPVKVLDIDQLVQPDIYRAPQVMRTEGGLTPKT